MTIQQPLQLIGGIKATCQTYGASTYGAAYAVPELYRSVDIREIKSKNWTITPSKYIQFIDHDLDIDYPAEMARIQNEMKQILAAEKQSQKMLEEAFRGIGYNIDEV